MGRHLLPLLLFMLSLYVSQASKNHQKNSKAHIQNAQKINYHRNEVEVEYNNALEEEEEEDKRALEEEEEEEEEEEDNRALEEEEEEDKRDLEEEEEEEEEEEDNRALEEEEEEEEEEEDNRALEEDQDEEDFEDDAEEESWALMDKSKRPPCSNRKCVRWYRGWWSDGCNGISNLAVAYCKKTGKKCCAPIKPKQYCLDDGGTCTLKDACEGTVDPNGCRGKKWVCCIP